MKTKSIATLLTTALAIALAAPASAAPAGKRHGSSARNTSAPKAERKVEHSAMRRIGPIGKGFTCSR